MSKTIVVDGLGLIGGSIALAIRKQFPEHHLIGVDIDRETLALAKQHGLIDSGFEKLQHIAAQADIIILAAPVSIILDHIEQLAQLSLKPGVIITDVGSTKQQIMKRAALLPRANSCFIGGHPMAGSHKSTLTAARANLFQSAYYFLVPSDPESRLQQQAIVLLKSLLSGLQVQWIVLTAAAHDRITAQISHLPHILATCLVTMSQDLFRDSPLSLKLAAGGFKSMTRIASSDPVMWTDILFSNQELLIDSIDAFTQRLNEIKQALKTADCDAIYQNFYRAKVTRDSLPTAEAAPFFDLLLNIPDQIGSVARVADILQKAAINLVNIHILEIREEIDGILQLSFANALDRARATNELQRHGLSVV